MFKTPQSSTKVIPRLSMQREDYSFGTLLGEGGLGYVFEATDNKTKEKVAIKAMKKRQVMELKQVTHIKQEK